MYTVNATNFFGFGVDAGDAQIGRVHNGNSQPIHFSVPIRFFGTSQSTLYVRLLHQPVREQGLVWRTAFSVTEEPAARTPSPS